MLTDRQVRLKIALEKEIEELDLLIEECKNKKYSPSIINLLMSGKILKRDKLEDIKRYE